MGWGDTGREIGNRGRVGGRTERGGNNIRGFVF